MKKINLQKGFTLIELLIVLALVAVLAMLAIPNLQAISSNQALSSTASDLLTSISTARSAAISRNRQTVVEPINPGDWTSGWRIYIDNDKNGTFDKEKDELISTSSVIPNNIIQMSDTVSSCKLVTKIGFGADGFLSNLGSNAYNGGVRFSSIATTRNRCVMLYVSGRARICGNDTSPTC